jgi:DNA (cytosine-5)-methyltransferase 1
MLWGGNRRPRLLDLYCCAGGAARGYTDAGFEVIGVDIEPQPNYPYEFHQMDALKVGTYGYDAIHASPPCQNDTAYKRRPNHVAPVAELIAPTRELLHESGLPYVIENVERAPLHNPVTLCGSSFGLDVRRHRLFETNWPLMVPPCAHGWQTPRFAQATNRSNLRSTVEVGVWRIDLETQKRAMGVDWDVTREELSQMIPPRYTEFIGKRLMEYIESRERIAA